MLTSLVALMAIVSVEAQTSAKVPRLVVNILIDQLRTDYLEMFASDYGDEGWQRLMTEGRFYTDVQQPFSFADRASATATLSTGAVPRQHGIPAQRWLSRQTLQPVFCVDDRRYSGLETSEATSANYLKTSTVTDELKRASRQKALVYGIAPERDMAVLMTGHSADAVLWLNDDTGQWCGTSYYGQLPSWVTSSQGNQRSGSALVKDAWEPIDGLSQAFKHKFVGNARFRQFKTSAKINEEVLQVATQCMSATRLGEDDTPDMLILGLYAGTYESAEAGEHLMELRDTYVRLDRVLASLIGEVTRRYGLENVVLTVTSTCYDGALYQPTLQAGTFNMERASMLLNMYLSAKYGQAQYVEATYENEIYIDHKVVEQCQQRLGDIQAECEVLLAQMEGVSEVYSQRSMTIGYASPTVARVRNGWASGRSGDIVIELNPGWKLVTQQNREIINKGQAYVEYPLFVLGNDVRAQRINGPVSSTALAPTLARCLRIRAPNASTVAPLQLK